MKCLRCSGNMYRVVRPGTQDSKATCTKCCQWTDCAMCEKCKDTKCLGCYNKAVTAQGRPKEIRSEPIVPDELEI